MKMKVSEILKATGGALLRGEADVAVSGVSTDSRAVGKGDIFFAIKGPRFDGHDFIKEVSIKGAQAAVVDRDVPFEGIADGFCVIKTGDALAALGALAGHWRRRCNVKVVAITGSVGKTSTKEMIASILKVSRKVLKTEGNRNNLIGVPLTLLGLDNSAGAAVIELGISIPGEMQRLVEISDPDVAVITNVGRAHLQTLGSVDNVAREKGTVFRLMKTEGIRVVNMDDPWTVKAAEGAKEVITFSLERAADVRVLDYGVMPGFAGMRAVYDVKGAKVEVEFPAPGVANVINGAGAIAACLPFGVETEDIAEGLGSYVPAHGRMEVLRVNGLIVLDDSYNANPDSVEAALHTLKEARGRKVAVLGDMLELGPASAKEHREIGRLATELAIDVIVAVGENALYIGQGAVFADKDASRVFCCKEKTAALGALKDILRQGDTVLVKGSRGVALEEVVEGIKGFVIKV